MFDCSVKYKFVSSINEQVSGADLTNQIVAVLIRFQQEPIDIMADVESMFFQEDILLIEH